MINILRILRYPFKSRFERLLLENFEYKNLAIRAGVDLQMHGIYYPKSNIPLFRRIARYFGCEFVNGKQCFIKGIPRTTIYTNQINNLVKIKEEEERKRYEALQSEVAGLPEPDLFYYNGRSHTDTGKPRY